MQVAALIVAVLVSALFLTMLVKSDRTAAGTSGDGTTSNDGGVWGDSAVDSAVDSGTNSGSDCGSDSGGDSGGDCGGSD